MIKDLTNKTKEKLDKYLEFDSDLIFKICDYCEVYGGFLRDSINNIEPGDVDFMCLSNSSKILFDLLIENGYHYLESTYPSKFNEQYKELRIINEPKTFVNKNFKKVQIIVPVNKNNVHSNYYKMLQNVDFSCCGLSYNGNIIRENFHSALLHVLSKCYVINEEAWMYNQNRILERKFKIENKGFVELDSKNEKYKAWEKRLERSGKLRCI
jgi:hypothetical protein